MSSISASGIRGDRVRLLLFCLFFASGFCSLVYQIVWLRMAFAHFGIITPVLSVVISVFMLGLGGGSLLAGRWGGALCARLGWSPAAVYGFTELLIGVGAFAAPASFRLGEEMLLAFGPTGSTPYLALSALAITLAILPWCMLMGATFPLMMAFVRTRWPGDTQSFSFLYRANVLGAAAGALMSALVLIETLGFRRTSIVAAMLNCLIAATGFWLSRDNGAIREPDAPMADVPAPQTDAPTNLVLFVTGFSSMAMEVVWTRGFTIILLTTIYAFAAILTTYLVGTAFGAAAYRERLQPGRTLPQNAWLLVAAALTACLPAVFNDPRLQSFAPAVLLSIFPFCFVLGFLTPKLVDDASGGDPGRAARSYAVNILGSVLGPLVAGYVLVTHFDTRVCLLILALPLIGLAAWAVIRSRERAGLQRVALTGCVGVALFGFLVSRSFEEGVIRNMPHEVHRDYAATAIPLGTGMDKQLLVNGVNMSFLVETTKIMAHLPLAVHGHARDGLVICFGMGTSFRSMASWGIETTVVDLASSVIDSFGYFHADAASVVANPKVHIVADDGRRFLTRNNGSFDVIVIDPPPPLPAAGSSLLYSREMYETVKRRLRPDGVLQQWLPGTLDWKAESVAVARTLAQAFPHVVAYRAVDAVGVHFLASMQPIPDITTEELLRRQPPSARSDLMEWAPQSSPEALSAIMPKRLTSAELPPYAQPGPIISDDRPFNEYFLLRSLFGEH